VNVILALVLVCLSTVTSASEAIICNSDKGKKEAVIYTSLSEDGLCKVDYRFNGLEKTLLSGASQDKCERQAEQIVSMHRDKWGWDCQLLSEYQPSSDLAEVLGTASEGISEKTVNEYKRASSLSAAVASLSNIRMMVQEHYMRNGEMPTKLSDLRLSRSDMADSQYIRDLTLGEGGVIYFLGKGNLGYDTVVSLEQKDVLGGTSSEMVCTTSEKFNRIDYCGYDPTLKFPF
jgi:hypothetical protein